MLVRGPSLEATMSQYLIARIEAAENIEVRFRTEVAAAAGDGHLESLTLRHRDTGDTVERARPPGCTCSSAPRRGPTGWATRCCATTTAS